MCREPTSWPVAPRHEWWLAACEVARGTAFSVTLGFNEAVTVHAHHPVSAGRGECRQSSRERHLVADIDHVVPNFESERYSHTCGPI